MTRLLGLAPEAMEALRIAALLLAIILGAGLTLLGAAFDRRARRRDRLARRRYRPERGTLHAVPPGETGR